jgi:hypothetical protein
MVLLLQTQEKKKKQRSASKHFTFTSNSSSCVRNLNKKNQAIKKYTKLKKKKKVLIDPKLVISFVILEKATKYQRKQNFEKLI